MLLSAGSGAADYISAPLSWFDLFALTNFRVALVSDPWAGIREWFPSNTGQTVPQDEEAAAAGFRAERRASPR
jgi:hypothetical protein